MRMNKTAIFQDDCPIIDTPMSGLNDEALAYLLNGVQLELEKRNSKAIRTVIQWLEKDGQDMKED